MAVIEYNASLSSLSLQEIKLLAAAGREDALKLYKNKNQQAESRSLSTVERRIIKSPKICNLCRDNNDPNNVPVHPNCDCSVVTDSISTGVAEAKSRFLNTLQAKAIEIISDGEIPSAIQLNSDTVSIMDSNEVRWGDLARWLEQIQPYLEAGDQYISIIVDDDSEEAIAQVEEAISVIAEDTEQFTEAVLNKKLWFSLAKAVVL